MAILTGLEIIDQIENGHIKIGNLEARKIQPNSIDLTLGNKISFYSLTEYGVKIGQINKNTVFETYGMLSLENPDDEKSCGFVRGLPILDSALKNQMLEEEIPESGYVLLPRILYLVETNESVWSDMFVTEVSGKSSLARLGISVHKTAGYANIGHEFKWILEVEVTHPVKIYPGMEIGQMYFHTTVGSTELQYSGKYKGLQMDNEICGSLSFVDHNNTDSFKKDEDTDDSTSISETIEPESADTIRSYDDNK